jgi:hypothetical protein
VPALSLSDAQRLKFRLLAEGVSISPQARHRLNELRGKRKLTPADYASTTGLIINLEDDVWVNAPFSDHNSNFVVQPECVLHANADGFIVYGNGLGSDASVWLPPICHDAMLSTGRPASHFTFTHGDRVRLSPIRGCAMRCVFCNIPFEDRYAIKPIELMVEALAMAFSDPLQPAHHLLISGGTPSRRDVPFLQEVYERVLRSFPDRKVDIMMVPIDGLLDLPRLKALGLHELSINIELFDDRIANKLMPQKHAWGLSRYLDFIAEAAAILGPGRVRSMIMVGLEPLESTIAGVQAIAAAGGVPVLSPFRPAQSTPLRDFAPLSAGELEEVFLRATDVAAAAGVALGPSCPPCTHNTLTLVPRDTGLPRYAHPHPAVV